MDTLGCVKMLWLIPMFGWLMDLELASFGISRPRVFVCEKLIESAATASSMPTFIDRRVNVKATRGCIFEWR